MSVVLQLCFGNCLLSISFGLCIFGNSLLLVRLRGGCPGDLLLTLGLLLCRISDLALSLSLLRRLRCKGQLLLSFPACRSRNSQLFLCFKLSDVRERSLLGYFFGLALNHKSRPDRRQQYEHGGADYFRPHAHVPPRVLEKFIDAVCDWRRWVVLGESLVRFIYPDQLARRDDIPGRSGQCFLFVFG